MLVWLLLLLSVIVSWVVIPSALGKKKKKLQKEKSSLDL